MSLTTEVEAFYGTPVLAQLTNTTTGVTTVNATRLAQAVALTEACFVAIGVEIDITDPVTGVLQLAHAIEGVALWCAFSKREASAGKALVEWKGRLKTELSLVTHNNRVAPRGNSQLDIAQDAIDRLKPDFDARTADAMVPGGVPGYTRWPGPPATDPP